MKKKLIRQKSRSRLKEVLKMRKKGATLEEVGKKFGVTSERVRQIIEFVNYKRCPVHKVLIYSKEDFCTRCFVLKDYQSTLKSLSTRDKVAFQNMLKFEARRLSHRDRSAPAVIQRALFVKFLKDKKRMKFSDISQLLNREPSSVENLYNKKNL